MTDSMIQLIEEKIDSFPPLPATVARVIEVTNTPESSASDLLRAVVSDQSICTAILKIANSSLFGRPKEVRSLESAIMVLGFNEVRSIVLANAVVSSFNVMTKQHKLAVTSFWEHAFTAGLAAKIIGEHLNRAAGQYFIAGLLHDIGKLAMLLTFDEEYPPATWMAKFSSEEQLSDEKHAFAISHGQIGSHLLRKWHFPEDILATIEFHHAPLEAIEFASFAQVIQLADALSYFCCNSIVEDNDLITSITTYLPGIEKRWLGLKLPWQDVLIELWYTWLKIDREHGSSIMTFLSC